MVRSGDLRRIEEFNCSSHGQFSGTKRKVIQNGGGALYINWTKSAGELDLGLGYRHRHNRLSLFLVQGEKGGAK